jgi:hypothetical protein
MDLRRMDIPHLCCTGGSDFHQQFWLLQCVKSSQAQVLWARMKRFYCHEYMYNLPDKYKSSIGIQYMGESRISRTCRRDRRYKELSVISKLLPLPCAR